MGTRHETTASYEQEASRWAAAGRPDQAARLYAQALELEPGNSRIRMRLAACLVDCGRSTTAATEYIEIARDYAAQHRGSEAVAIGHRILQLDAGCFCCSTMADILREVGGKAGPLCRHAARAHHVAGRDDEAALLLRLCAELDPSETESWCELAQIYLNHDMPAEAAEALRTGGRRLLSAGNNARYIEFARAVLTMEPEDLETLRELPRVLLKLGEPQRAVVELSTLLRVNPGDVVGYETLAHSFAAIGRTSVSLSVLEQLTMSLTRLGRRDEVEAIIDRARSWRDHDLEFCCSVAELHLAQPSQPIRIDDHRPTTSQGTVVLSIADLTQRAHVDDVLESENSTVLDLTEMVELVDGEDSIILRLSDLSRLRRNPITSETTPSGRDEQTPSPDTTQSLRYGQTPPPETTQSLDLRDIIEMHADAISSRGETIVGVVIPRP